jgi:hypothetical protein
MRVQRQQKQRKKSIGSQDKNNKMGTSSPPVMHEPGRQSVQRQLIVAGTHGSTYKKRNKEIETRGEKSTPSDDRFLNFLILAA